MLPGIYIKMIMLSGQTNILYLKNNEDYKQIP